MNKFPIMNLFLICIMIFVGCANEKISEKERIKTIIAKYNSALTEAHKNQFYKPLGDVASEDEVRRVKTGIEAYIIGDRIMDSELKRMDFVDIEIDGETARVKTSEDWRYRWLNYRTGETVEPSKDIQYEMLYQLDKTGDGWIVDRVKDLSINEEDIF